MVLRKILFGFTSLTLLSIACTIGTVYGQREEVPTAESTKKSELPTKSDVVDKPVEKRSERIKAAKDNGPAKKQLRQIALSGSYDDLMQPVSLDPASLLLGQAPAKSKSFYRLCETLQEMGTEENLSHVLFDLSDSAIGFNSAQLDELTRYIVALKAKGKKTIAWLEDAGNVQLAIAACCDEIFMADFGGVDMPSSALETMFHRDAGELICVSATVVSAGDFEVFVAPYSNPGMS